MSFIKKTSTTRFIFFLIFDVILISISIYISFLLRFDGTIPAEYLVNQGIQKVIFWTLLICLPIFYFFKLYSFSWSYVSTQELVSLFKATTLGFIFLGIIIFFSKEFPLFTGFPRSVFIISYFLIFISCGALRLSKRIYLMITSDTKSTEKEKTIIVGAGDAGEQILRSIISSTENLYSPVGFVDDGNIKQGITIHGLKVMGRVKDIPEIVKENNIKQIIIALPSAGSSKIREAVELARKSGVIKIKIAPALSEIIAGSVSFKNLKNVGVEDLLGREEVLLDTKQIESFVKDKVVLITGAAGSIGSELSRQIAKFKPSTLILLDQDETGIFNISKELDNNFSGLKMERIVADVTDKEKINKILNKLKPEIVFHAAAYKHVPLMEENATEAVKNNIFGTKNLVEASIASGVEKFIFISTDKAINPTSIMGCTKRVGEMICQLFNKKEATKFISVRFGNVLNSRGSVIPIFREQIKRGGPIEVTHPDMKRYFMLTSEACLLVLEAAAMGQGGEVFVLDMGEPVKILDLAKEMVKLSGLQLDKDIAIVFTGIRPGEKLFEEILSAEEGTATTKNKKIFIAKLSNINFENFDQKINELHNDFIKMERKDIGNSLKRIIPSFSPDTSSDF